MAPLVGILAVVVLLAGPAAAETSSPSPAPRTVAMAKPTQADKRCQASRRRVDRHQQAIAEADARTARERSARETCKTRRACDRLDRALKAADTRQKRHEKQLAQLDAEAQRACSPPPS